MAANIYMYAVWWGEEDKVQFCDGKRREENFSVVSCHSLLKYFRHFRLGVKAFIEF